MRQSHVCAAGEAVVEEPLDLFLRWSAQQYEQWLDVETAVGGASCLASLPALLSGGEPRSAGWGAGAAAALRRR